MNLFDIEVGHCFEIFMDHLTQYLVLYFALELRDLLPTWLHTIWCSLNLPLVHHSLCFVAIFCRSILGLLENFCRELLSHFVAASKVPK